MTRQSRLLQVAMALLATMAGPATAQAIQEYAYEPDRIYPVRTGLGITTQIELSPNEEILDFSAGFSNGWELSRRDNVFYLKPKDVDVDTNMLIRTATHSYILELKVVATDWTALDQAKAAGVQYKVVFTYPADAQFTATKAEPAKELSATLDKNRVYFFDYDYATRSKHLWLVPHAVYDDGQFTYIAFRGLKDFPSGDFPAVFVRERENGDDSIVNTTVEGDTLVVHGTYSYLVIRHGSDTVGLRRNTPE